MYEARRVEQGHTMSESESRPPRSSLASWLVARSRPAEPRSTPWWMVRAEPVPAAEDTRVFPLRRMRPRDVWSVADAEPERPGRRYPIRGPGETGTAEVRPEFHGVREMTAATGRCTWGIGMMFPPHTLHARDSTSVVVGDGCELTQVDHVHLRRAEVGPDDALRSAVVRRIAARAKPGADNSAVVGDLRAALARRIDKPVAAGCEASIHRAETVQLGNDAMTQLDTRYVVERTLIPAGALLAGHEDLAARYVGLVAGTGDDPDELADFLADLVGRAGNAETDNLLGYADGLPKQRTTVLGLFGYLTVDGATAITVNRDGGRGAQPADRPGR